jgi:hypothetical protein
LGLPRDGILAFRFLGLFLRGLFRGLFGRFFSGFLELFFGAAFFDFVADTTAFFSVAFLTDAFFFARDFLRAGTTTNCALKKGALVPLPVFADVNTSRAAVRIADDRGGRIGEIS